MKETVELSREQKLVILASRLTFSKQNEDELRQLVNNKMDWYYVFRFAIKNKVVPLIWYNLRNRDYDYFMPPHLRQAFQFFYLGIRNRNMHFIKELQNVLSRFSQDNIPCTPLKGSYLIPNIFKDYGIRGMNDIDCMVMRTHSKKVVEIMNSLGYIQGTLDLKNRIISPFSREQEILWKTKMSNLAAFYKIDESGYHEFTKFDFTISLDLELEYDLVNKMLERAEINEKSGQYNLRNSDFFVHLCCHLYKEASNATFVLFHKDLNLIKFCDIREFVLHKMDKNDLQESIEFAIKHGLVKALYFVLFYLREIYSDGYEAQLLEALNVDDESFIYTYSDKELGQSLIWKKSFWERLFSEDNEDELESKPKFFDVFSVEHAMKKQ